MRLVNNVTFRKSIAAIVTLMPIMAALTLAASAQASTYVTCIWENNEGSRHASATALAAISNENEDAWAFSRRGIEIGKYAFSFDLSALLDQDAVSVYAVLYENNRVQNEVGSFECSLTHDSPVCGEAIDMDGEPMGHFSCHLLSTKHPQ